MATKAIKSELAKEFSSPEATATNWSEGERVLSSAQLYWLATVRPNGQPNVAPLVGVWVDGAFFFSTGDNEQKAKNFASNPRCTITTGCNVFGDGIDVVVEGRVERVSDRTAIQRAADAFTQKYEPPFQFKAADGGFAVDVVSKVVAPVFKVTPSKAFGFGKGEVISQTRWRF